MINIAKDKEVLNEDLNQALHEKAKNGCSESRQRLIVGNMKLVLKALTQIRTAEHETEDLFQVGMIGLIRAVDSYRPEFGTKFSTYLTKMAIWNIKRFIIENNAVRISRNIRKTARRIRQFEREFIEQHQREPDFQTIEKETRLPWKEITLALNTRDYKLSLSSILLSETGDEKTVEDLIYDKNESQDKWADAAALKDALNKITPEEQFIIKEKYYKGKSQSYIAEHLGVSQVQVSRLEQKSLQKLRKHLMTL